VNLLRDAWIPIQGKAGIEFLRLQDLLCRDGDWRIETHRDDLNLSALQLAICLVQVCFPPNDFAELRARESTLMDQTEYLSRTEALVPWFNVIDERHPFMQVADTPRQEPKSLQKLLIGMPEPSSGSPSSNAFFNQSREIREVCLPMAAIMLFQQATNGVGLGGSFFAKSLKGDAPLTTLVYHEKLRRSVWRNVVSESAMPRETEPRVDDQYPTWVEPIRTKGDGKDRASAVTPSSSLCVRALFWQPARVLLDVIRESGVCDLTGKRSEVRARGFFSEPHKFGYIGSTFCRHPHSPVRIREGNTFSHMKWPDGLSFWRDATGLFWPHLEASQGVSPALVVTQHSALWFDEPLTVLLSGYSADNQKITARRHESYVFPAGWPAQMENTRLLMDEMVTVGEAIGKAGFTFAKFCGKSGWDKKLVKGFADSMRTAFLARAEPLMHATLREIEWDKIEQERLRLSSDLRRIAVAVFDDMTEAYTHSPSGLMGYVRGKRSLYAKLHVRTEVAA